VRSFTATCGKMKPAAIAAQLTPYLDAMVEVIHRHGGFVDKFIGDAILAAWGIVPNDGDAATQAFACAREMVAIASKKKFGGLPIRIGVGLNRGRVFAGNVGGSGKRQFTILGTAVNLTQRFESHTKAARAEIVAGNSFYMKLPHSERTGWTAHRGTKFKGAALQTVYSFQVMKKSNLVRRAEFVHRNGRRK
jgi:adenylate cyclase